MAYVDEDGSSGTGDDVNMLEGHKRQAGVPASGGRKRSRKATGDAIVDAMMQIAAASKMRASAIMKNQDKFSISKCINGLDEMQDTPINMDDIDLELDEMELVAAAAGYYYYSSLTKQPSRGLSHMKCEFMTEVLNGHDDFCREMLRMDRHVFQKLCGILRQRAMLRDTSGVMIEEQLAIFLNVIGHNERNRVIQERFQHSGETISRHFNNVLKAIKSLSREFLQLPGHTTSPKILNSSRFYPYFKDCIGVIDGMHIPAHVPAKDQSRFRNKKGSVSDSRVLRAVLDDPDQNFPQIPQGKYYLVDQGYLNTEGFIAPFHGVRNDWLFSSLGGTLVNDEPSNLDELPDVQFLSSIQEQIAFSLRESVSAAMFDDFLNKWDEW
ncbi:hypothetical protein P8452_55653 [Trifolium repens]|nr:hypothetical protein P8452_55653 [Trifolium repens]